MRNPIHEDGYHANRQCYRGDLFRGPGKKTSGERVAYLDEACKGDEVLRRCVDRMLDSSGKVGNFLQPEPRDKPATLEHPPIEERPGSIIGPYKLLQELGEGGFGVVFMAEQEQPVRRRVALKIIRPGMDSKQVVARFEAERQALALMDHPNIARVLDGGTTDSGRPYFVMELVKGTPITEFCDKNRLAPRERLELFIPVCQAVQHAHQKGIIHRDLKPSNVLVAMYDDKPVPKVIDFGVAKAIEQKLTEQTLFTRVGQVIGTLEYMSPEQASLNALDVDTRSDVYALGVLLYELLTGTTPLNKGRLEGVAFLEMLRLIREEEPPKPSTRLSESGDALTGYAMERRSDSQKLPRLVKGELDWITMKALDKDRGRRYATANALARDVQRYLDDEQVEACPPTIGYRLHKYVRKHKAIIGTMSAVTAVLLIGIAATTWQALRATDAEGVALTKQRDAEKAQADEAAQRKIADAAKAKAQQERDAAKAEREKVRRLHYTAALNLIPAAWEADNIVRVQELLDEQRPKADEVDLRGFEWRYWDNQCHAELRTLQVDGAFTHGAAFSGDGARVAYAYPANPKGKTGMIGSPPKLEDFAAKAAARHEEVDLLVKVRDLAADREIGSWKVTGNVRGTVEMQLNRDGTRLAVMSGPSPFLAGSRRFFAWDVASGKELFARELTAKAVGSPLSRSFALSPDGKLLAIGERQGPGFKPQVLPPTQIWHVDDPMRAPIALESSGGADHLLFSPDGTRVAAGIGGKGPEGASHLRLWDAATGKPRGEIPDITNARDIAFSANGTRLAVIAAGLGAQSKIRVWDCSSADEPKLLHATPGPEMNTLASGTRYLAFSPDGGRLAYLHSFSRSVRIMESATGKEHQTVKSSMGLLSVAFSADGARVRAAGFRKYEEADGFPIRSGSAVREWAAQPLKERAPQDAKTGIELTVWSPDGSRRAVVTIPTSKAEGIRILDRAGKLIRVFSEHTGGSLLPPPVGVFFSPDGRLLYSRDVKGEAKIWEPDSGKVRWEGNLKTSMIEDAPNFSLWTGGIAFSPDGRFMTLPSPVGIKVVSTADFGEKFTVAGTGRTLFPSPDCFFSPDGRRLVVVDCPSTSAFDWNTPLPEPEKRQLKVWDVDAGREIESTTYLHLDRFSIRAQAIFSPDGRYFALSLPGPGAVTIYDAATGKERTVLKNALSFFPDRPTIVFSPDGDRVIVSRPDGPLQRGGIGPTVWETATGKFLFRLEGHPNAQNLQLVFSPDGKRIATCDLPYFFASGKPSSIKLWDAATGRELLTLKPENGGGTLAFSPGPLSFSPDGHRLLLQRPNGEGPSWDATPREATKQ
jgi:serine/threonine protein kinase/WD40 repeat protein